MPSRGGAERRPYGTHELAMGEGGLQENVRGHRWRTYYIGRLGALAHARAAEFRKQKEHHAIRGQAHTTGPTNEGYRGPGQNTTFREKT